MLIKVMMIVNDNDGDGSDSDSKHLSYALTITSITKEL